ncbi:MAG: ABC transporter permease [Acidobacteriaceae bacterium]|nr:ABC transporter permease [Acidobacteriaceae bacterium]MBV9502072.1 ABC transporter permease [Acidobacteriaceae bacterium]
MRWAEKLRMLARSLFRRRQLEADLADELQHHLQQEIESNVRAGMTPAEAKLAAQRLMGPVSLYKEECRDARGTRLIESFVRDLRYAARMLRRTPLFTVVAVLTLALGIGANTTVFTFVEDILLRSFPARNPQQLVSLNWNGGTNMAYPNYIDFRDRNTVFTSLIACRFNPANMSLRARENFRVWGYEASGNYFETLGISPELGRFFGSAEDGKPGANPVVVISHRYWQTRLAADPNVVGRAVKINGYPFTIIGIAPPSFLGTELILAGDYWVPMSMETQIEPGDNWLRDRDSGQVWTIGRLKPGVSFAQSEADLDRIAQQLARTYPNDINPKGKFELSRPGLVGTYFRGPVTAFGVAFMSIAGAALLLACINLAGMLLARASDRQREIGIRLAVGASRFQLLRQLMTESLLLAAGGGLLGLAIAFATCNLFSSWQPGIDLPLNTTLQPDRVVFCFTLAAVLVTTLLFGFAPALQTVRTDLVPSLKDEPVLSRFRRLGIRDLLVAGQIALSVILVISSVLVVRSLQHALSLNLGFNPDHAVAVSVDLRLQGYDTAHSRRFDANLLEKASALPGLQSVGIISNLPLRAGESDEVISRADRPMPKRSEWHPALIYNISPNYLRTAATRLLMGRDVNEHDREGAPHVAIINEALAHVVFGRENPLGKIVRMGPPGHDKGFEVIGVVETGKYDSLGEDPKSAIFLPIAQAEMRWTTLVARTRLPAQQATDTLRKAVLDLNPELTLFNVGTLRDQLSLPLFPARAAAIVLGVFGVLAMVLAATGLFALMAYSVARRMREIGIRMALGARPSQVLSSVLRRTVVLCAIGLSIGITITLAVGRLLSAVLYGISPRDPLTYITAVLMMGAVALLAAWNPAARAIHVDPARTLREQ